MAYHVLESFNNGEKIEHAQYRTYAQARQLAVSLLSGSIHSLEYSQVFIEWGDAPEEQERVQLTVGEYIHIREKEYERKSNGSNSLDGWMSPESIREAACIHGVLSLISSLVKSGVVSPEWQKTEIGDRE